MIRYIAAALVAASLSGVAQAQIAGNPAREQAFLAQIEAAKAASKYKEAVSGLDMLRAMQAAGLPLTAYQRVTAGEFAMSQGVAIEAEAWLQPMVATGEFGGDKDQRKQRNAVLYRQVQVSAKADREGGLETNAERAATRPNGSLYFVVGQSYAAKGDFAKAAELIAAALAKGLDPVVDGYGRLDLGIAQYRAGRIEEARATWREIGGDNGAKELAQAWLMIAQS